MPYLVIAPSPERGRGVFATKRILAGTIIEISPVIVLSKKDRKILEATLLYSYIFEWGNSRTQGAVGLGYISLYNHTYNSNCEYEMDYENKLITIRTVKKVNKGEELYINYNAEPNNNEKMWFDVK